MVEVDVYWFYWMSMAIYRLHTIPDDGLPLGLVSGDLGIARIALEGFGDDHARAFPKTAGAIRQILDWIDQIMPEREPSPLVGGTRIIRPADAVALKNNLASLTVFLRDEAKHNYVLCVQNQRFLSANSLVEEIEGCFAADSWKVIDSAAKREFKESGRCLVLERYTGAGFHALRGVECVIRQYIVDLTGTLPKKRDWGHYIDVLKNNNADAGLTAVLDNIRSRERNPLMHPEDWLDIDDAIGIFTIAQTAIRRLTEDMRRKDPKKYP